MNREMGTARPGGRGEHAFEVDGTHDTADHAAPGAGQTARSDGQALAALGATRVDDGAAAARLHANEKTVGAGATDFGGLVGAFHGGVPGWPDRRADWPGWAHVRRLAAHTADDARRLAAHTDC